MAIDNMFLRNVCDYIPIKIYFIKAGCRGAWVAQLVKHLTLDFGSGLDFRVVSSSPMLGFALGMESI